jgi:hypothetical protein
VQTKVFDAKGWVPQSRKRIYFVGFRDDLSAAAVAAFAWPQEPPEGCGGTVESVLELEEGEGEGEGGGGGPPARGPGPRGAEEGGNNRALVACEVSPYQAGIDRPCSQRHPP